MPRVLGYAIGVRNRIAVPDWDAVASLTLDPMRVQPETQVAAALNMNRPSILAPGGVHDASLRAFRAKHRIQQLAFQTARDLTRTYLQQATCEAPAHVLFPQVLGIVRRYIEEKVRPLPPAERIDAFLAPSYGWIIERLAAAIKPDASAGETPEIPELDRDRPCATSDISVFTTKDAREVIRSHVNLVVNDTETWEQSAAYHLDTHAAVHCFRGDPFGLNFAIPYFHNDQHREYLPDYVVHIEQPDERYLIAELKGADRDGLAGVKKQAAERWCAAVNASGEFGNWNYKVAFSVPELVQHLDRMHRS